MKEPNTVARLAKTKNLPEDFLHQQGIEDSRGDRPAISFQYDDYDGALLFTRTRPGPYGERFHQPAGVGLAAYGRWHLPGFNNGVLFLTEGETDTLTLWFHGFPALGLPGANTSVSLTAEDLAQAGADRIYVCPDNDEQGRAFVAGVAARLGKLGWQGKAFTVALPEGTKDVSDLYLREGPQFLEALRGLIAAAPLLYDGTTAAKSAADGNGRSFSPGARARATVGSHGPAEPTAEEETREVATIADLARAGALVRWLCPGWLPLGVLTALAAEGGTGKTRFCADLIRRVAHQLPWPDGSPMTLPADAKALWVAADNHHDELVDLARDFKIEANVYLNAWRDDPFGGVSLEEVEDYRQLELRVKKVKPAFIVIDTVGNCTDRNLSRQEDARAFYMPLQVLARRYSCAVLALTHLNATGKFLGRRVLEKVRVAIRMDKPDPDTEKRALTVPKTFGRPPKALGVIMGDHGNDYDFDPPRAPVEELTPGKGPGRPATAIGPATEWLRARLNKGPARVVDLINEAEETGVQKSTLYRGFRALAGANEYSVQGRKWWALTFTDTEV